MNVLQFLLTFAILSIIGSTAIIGFYICTRGQWIITPDGKWKKTGMIFKYWSLFWEQYQKTKTVYYKGEGLQEKFEFLKKVHPKIVTGRLQYDNSHIWAHSGNTITPAELVLIKDALQCDVAIGLKDELILSIQEPVYDWPEWVQKPISSCPTCLAGPYGTAIWLAFLKLQRDAFAWTDSPVFAYIVFGMIFLLTLSTINTILSHKLKL
jgi:hypothetical protein